MSVYHMCMDEAAPYLIEEIRQVSRTPVCLMEVCGTHTVSIFKHGIRSVLPNTITLLSGPGCPVCVTAQREIDGMIALAAQENVIITTFGDLMRVPGTRGSLQQERASGRDIRMVYSADDALRLAQSHPEKEIVFLGVGFETTAPTIAATILDAARLDVKNFSVYSAHKRVPPALSALMPLIGSRVHGFILPGHVSVIIGVDGYRPFFEAHPTPCAITGFDPVDILRGVLAVVTQVEAGKARLENVYERAVTREGNPRAMALMDQVFEVRDAPWRGLDEIPESGLFIRDGFSSFDASRKFEIRVPETISPQGCACGEILTGRRQPFQCGLFRKACTPETPMGPCMVSTEGTCSAYYRFHH